MPDLTGAEAVVLGRSNIVGKPMAALLLAENCTVTLAHSRSRDIPAVVRRADILVAAVGRPEFVRGDWIKPGAVVIDVGFNRVAAAGGRSKLVGDVAFAEAQGIAGGDHPGPRRRRPDDHRLPVAQHPDCRLPQTRAGRAGRVKLSKDFA